jgi:membrane protease YdiL (CAAX protease family)
MSFSDPQPVREARPLSKESEDRLAELLEEQLFPDRVTPVSRGRAIVEIIVVAAALLAPGIVRDIFFETNFGKNIDKLGDHIYLSVFLSGMFVTIVTLCVIYFSGQTLRQLGLRFKNLSGEFSSAFWALVIIYGIQMIFPLIAFWISPEFVSKIAKQRFGVATMFPPASTLFLVGFTLFVGFYEELVFRGFLISRLRNIFGSAFIAVIVSSILFGVIHFYQDYLAMFQIVTIAMVLGTLYVRRKSLISPILVHTVFNFINIMMAIYLTKNPVDTQNLKKLLEDFDSIRTIVF